MIIPDANVLVGAFRADADRHAGLREWLEGAVAGPDLLALSDSVLGGVVRILTHPRVMTLDHDVARFPGLRLAYPLPG